MTGGLGAVVASAVVASIAVGCKEITACPGVTVGDQLELELYEGSAGPGFDERVTACAQWDSQRAPRFAGRSRKPQPMKIVGPGYSSSNRSMVGATSQCPCSASMVVSRLWADMSPRKMSVAVTLGSDSARRVRALAATHEELMGRGALSA